MSRPALLLTLFAICAAPAAGAEPGMLPKGFAKLADVTVTVEPAKAKAGETVRVSLTVSPKNGGWTYPTTPKDPAQTSKNEV